MDEAGGAESGEAFDGGATAGALVVDDSDGADSPKLLGAGVARCIRAFSHDRVRRNRAGIGQQRVALNARHDPVRWRGRSRR